MSKNVIHNQAESKPIGAKDPDTRANEPAAVWRHYESVQLWAKNPKKNDEKAKGVADSIIRLGFGSAVLTWYDPDLGADVYIAGNTRAKAVGIVVKRFKRASPKDLEKWHPNAIELAKSGLIPCRSRNDLSRSDATLMALADNKHAEDQPWDPGALATMLSEFSLDDALIAGFDQEEIEKAIGVSGVEELDTSEAFGDLPSGEKDPFQRMTFVLHDSQVDSVKSALQQAKSRVQFSGENQNSNGNALAAICEAYLGQC